MQKFLPQNGIRQSGMQRDCNDALLNLVFHLERDLKLLDAAGLRQDDAWQKAFLKQLVKLCGAVSEQTESGVPSIRERKDLISQRLEFRVEHGDLAAEPALFIGLGKPLERLGVSRKVGFRINDDFAVLGQRLANVIEHRPRGLAGVDLHLQDGLFERLLDLDDLAHVAVDSPDVQIRGETAYQPVEKGVIDRVSRHGEAYRGEGGFAILRDDEDDLNDQDGSSGRNKHEQGANSARHGLLRGAGADELAHQQR